MGSDKKTIGHVSHGPKQDEDEDIDAVIARLIDAQSSGERFKLISETEHAAALERVREEGRREGVEEALTHLGKEEAYWRRLAFEFKARSQDTLTASARQEVLLLAIRDIRARNTEGGGDEAG